MTLEEYSTAIMTLGIQTRPVFVQRIHYASDTATVQVIAGPHKGHTHTDVSTADLKLCSLADVAAWQPPEPKSARDETLAPLIKEACQDYQHSLTGQALYSCVSQRLEAAYDAGRASREPCAHKLNFEFLARGGICNTKCPVFNSEKCPAPGQHRTIRCFASLLAHANAQEQAAQ